jgi:hypothetical protein
MSEWTYSCDKARKQLVQMARMLAEVGVLQRPPDDGLMHSCVQRCAPCCKDRGIKKCTGWQTVVKRGVLSFRPYIVEGHDPVRIDLSGDISFRRAKPEKSHKWQDHPICNSTMTVEIVSTSNNQLLERHHHDLANPNQSGPVWHFQYGGNPADDLESLPTSWLSPPRWPELPLDLALLADTITYNFFFEEWRKLNANGAWVNLMLETEQLVMSHFAEYLHTYFNSPRAGRDQTWLAAQDNIIGGLNPRP